MSVGFAADKSKDKSKDESKAKFIPEFPEFKSLQEWEPLKSTKMDTCARICRHMLTRDDVPPIIFEEGQAKFPQIPPSPHPPKMESKILIYQEFTSLRPLLSKVDSSQPVLSILPMINNLYFRFFNSTTFPLCQ